MAAVRSGSAASRPSLGPRTMKSPCLHLSSADPGVADGDGNLHRSGSVRRPRPSSWPRPWRRPRVEREHRRDALGGVARRHDLDPHAGAQVDRLPGGHAHVGVVGQDDHLRRARSGDSLGQLARRRVGALAAMHDSRAPSVRKMRASPSPLTTAMTCGPAGASSVAAADGAGEPRSRRPPCTRSRTPLACRSRFSTAIRLSPPSVRP